MPACDSISSASPNQLLGSHLADDAVAVAGGDLCHVVAVSSAEAGERDGRRLAGFLQDADLAFEDRNQAALNLEFSGVVNPLAHRQLTLGGDLEGIVVRGLGRLLLGGCGRLLFSG